MLNAISSPMFSLTAQEWNAVILSLKVAACSTVVCVLPGILCGWLLARKRFWGKTLLDGVIHLPLVLPPVVVGYLLLASLGRQSALGRFLADRIGLHLIFTWHGAVLAAAVMGFPLLVRSVRLGIELVDPRLEQAAGTLGAGRWRVFRTVTLPLALPGILGGMILAFARGLGEFGATITFAGNIPGQTRTLPLAMFTWLQLPGGDGPVLRLTVVAVVISLAALLASEILSRRMARRMARH